MFHIRLFNYFFLGDEPTHSQTREDIVKALMEGKFLEDALERQKFKKALQIIGRRDLAAGK